MRTGLGWGSRLGIAGKPRQILFVQLGKKVVELAPHHEGGRQPQQTGRAGIGVAGQSGVVQHQEPFADRLDQMHVNPGLGTINGGLGGRQGIPGATQTDGETRMTTHQAAGSGARLDIDRGPVTAAHLEPATRFGTLAAGRVKIGQQPDELVHRRFVREEQQKLLPDQVAAGNPQQFGRRRIGLQNAHLAGFKDQQRRRAGVKGHFQTIAASRQLGFRQWTLRLCRQGVHRSILFFAQVQLTSPLAHSFPHGAPSNMIYRCTYRSFYHPP